MTILSETPDDDTCPRCGYIFDECMCDDICTECGELPEDCECGDEPELPDEDE